MKSFFVCIWILFLTISSYGQSEAIWVYLEDESSQEALPDEIYSDVYYSPWLHAIGMPYNEEHIEVISRHCEIRSITRQHSFSYLSQRHTGPSLYSFGLEQIGVEPLIARGLNGKNVAIGVIDGGFLSANEIEPLQDLFGEGLIKYYRDFITPDLKPYAGVKTLDDRHGTDVLQIIAGQSSQTGIRHGLAVASDYYLARTDHGASETKVEEMYLVKALEWLDSLGVRLVNISLGYTQGFENPKHDYEPEDIDGTSALSKAVQKASDKGMLIVVAAGNDGNKDWHTLSVPADAPGVLTVGSTKFKHWDKMAFSSVGPENLTYLKPEIACFASDGTSFSTPLITGLAALIWQARPELSNEGVKEIIMQSGHLYPFGNNYVGYGVPRGDRVLDLIDQKPLVSRKAIKVYKDSYRVDKQCDEHYVVYHKQDKWRTMDESYVKASRVKPKIKRLNNASFTTVVLDNEVVYELQWMRAHDAQR